MLNLIHQIVLTHAKKNKDSIALTYKDESLSYEQLYHQIEVAKNGLLNLGLAKYDRVGIYLNKTIENIVSIFSTSAASGAFVPINPVLKAAQVQHIINDCNIKILITNSSRFQSLIPLLATFTDLHTVILTDNIEITIESKQVRIITWQEFTTINQQSHILDSAVQTSSDMAAIFYTSGSTGKPKGVVLSHLNIILGAKSVASYLNNTEKDKILALLPLSFDYGFSQLTTGFLVGAQIVLLDYLLPNDVLKAIEKHKITGLAGVPPLWTQLSKLNWQDKAQSIRYFTNSGGALNPLLLKRLRHEMPNATPYLMYGLTEAFRSTYLHPDKIDTKPTSIGQAIPNAEISVVNGQGIECEVDVIGELVHMGPLVSLGYWNAQEKTAQRFKQAPGKPQGIITKQLAVYSGDLVKRDIDGDIFFIGRNDEMIKSSGYRISPIEVEECLYQYEDAVDVATIGVPHNELGQAILTFVSVTNQDQNKIELTAQLKRHCQKSLANYMQPTEIIILNKLPKNNNGKLDRAELTKNYLHYFQGESHNENNS